MKNKPAKKLSINKESIRALQQQDLSQAAGGREFTITCASDCRATTCLHTFNTICIGG
jgi:hypothetical protein